MKDIKMNKEELKKQIQELRTKSADLILESMRVNDQANSLEAQIEQIDREEDDLRIVFGIKEPTDG